MSEVRDATDYPWFTNLPTRWADNDMFGHLNNAVYYVLIDTALGRLLHEQCGFDPLRADVMNVVLKNQCHYLRSLHYPDEVRIGVAVGRIGRSSVTYELGLFRNAEPEPSAVASVVEVWISKEEQVSVEIPAQVRSVLQRLQLPG